MSKTLLRIGISRCLLGETVRYDGGHKRDRFLTEVLGRHVEWVPVCPEVEAGLGVPREPMRLVGPPRAPRLQTVTTGLDLTTRLERFSRRRAGELASRELSGFVFKQNSPTCGVRQVPLYRARGGSAPASRLGTGIFARQFTSRFPLIPVEEEGRLNDPQVRSHFLTRVLAYARWRELARRRVTRRTLQEFHARHHYLLLAHSPRHHHALGRLLSRMTIRDRPDRVLSAYGRLFMEALRARPTTRTHAQVLRHIAGQFRERLRPQERQAWEEVLAKYRRRRVPLAVPVAMIQRHLRRWRLRHLAGQVYLNPHPIEQAIQADRQTTDN